MDKENETIRFQEFERVKLQVGRVTNAESLKGYNKILKITVDMGNEKRDIMSGIAKFYSPEELIGRSVIVCSNLEPKNFGENVSNGMILAVEKDKRPVLLTVSEEVEPGSPVS